MTFATNSGPPSINNTSTQATDIVAIMIQGSSTPLFPLARPLQCSVKPNAIFSEHPLEDGTTIADNRIIKATETDFTIFIPPGQIANIYSQFVSLYVNATQIQIQTKADIYKYQTILEMPHTETPEEYDCIILKVKTKQILYAVTQTGGYVPLKAINNSTIPRGSVQPIATPKPPRSSILFGGF